MKKTPSNDFYLIFVRRAAPLSDGFNFISRVIGFLWKLVIDVIGIDYIWLLLILKNVSGIYIFVEIYNYDR